MGIIGMGMIVVYLMWHSGILTSGTQCYLFILYNHKIYATSGVMKESGGVKSVWGSIALTATKYLSRGWEILPNMPTDEIMLSDGRQVPVFYCREGEKFARWVKFPKKVTGYHNESDLWIEIERDDGKGGTRKVKVPNTVLTEAMNAGQLWDNKRTENMIANKIANSYEMEQTGDIFDLMLGAIIGIMGGYYISFVAPPNKVLTSPAMMLNALSRMAWSDR